MVDPKGGVVWTRITPISFRDCVYPDVRDDSVTYTRTGFEGYPRVTVGSIGGSGGFTFNWPGSAPWFDFRPRWIRSAMIIFQSAAAGTFDLWYRDVDTGATRRLTKDTTNESAPAPRPGAPGLAYIEYDNPANATSADRRGRLVLMADTAGVPLPKLYLTPASLQCGDPDWDPTGTKLCFTVQDPADSTRHVFTLNLAPGDSLPVQITVGPYHDNNPRWSPDGQRILFASDRTGRSGIWTVHPLGEAHGLQVMAFEDPGSYVFTPAWTSDGASIVVASNGRDSNDPSNPLYHLLSLWHLTNLPPFNF